MLSANLENRRFLYDLSRRVFKICVEFSDSISFEEMVAKLKSSFVDYEGIDINSFETLVMNVMNDTRFDQILLNHSPNQNSTRNKSRYSFSANSSYNKMLREKYSTINKTPKSHNKELKNGNSRYDLSPSFSKSPRTTATVTETLENESGESIADASHPNKHAVPNRCDSKAGEDEFSDLSDENSGKMSAIKRRSLTLSQGTKTNEKTKKFKNSTKKKPKSIQNEDEVKKRKNDIPCRYSDFGGMEDVIKEIRELVEYPLNHPEVFKHLGVSMPRGILLYGPSGCGKTHLAMATAGELDVPFFRISSPEIVSGISGESETKIRKLFEDAKKEAPCIIFFDEIDCITSKKESNAKEMEKRIMAQLLISMDDLNQSLVIVMGATSKLDSIDPAFRRSGRFDREIYLGIPNEEARVKILKTISSKMRLEGSFDYELIASKTPGYVGSDLQALTREAANIAINRIFNSSLNSGESLNESEEPSRNGALNVKTAFTEEQLACLSIEMDDFLRALGKVQPSVKREGFVSTSRFTWDDVGALGEIKKKIQTYILEPLKYKKEFTKLNMVSPTGVLLYGPPGCGKTLLAKVIANEAQANFISVKGPELLNKFLGESERSIRNLFEKARLSSPCIIFFDEIDALVPKRTGSESMNSDRIVNQILVELDGLEERNQVFIIAATNRPDIIDPAILRPGRIDKLIHVPLPNAHERCLILKAHVKNMPFDPNLNFESIAFNQMCDGYSGADLNLLIKEASYFAFDQHIKYGKGLVLTQEHFEAALKKVVPSVSANEKSKYNSLDLRFGENK